MSTPDRRLLGIMSLVQSLIDSPVDPTPIEPPDPEPGPGTPPSVTTLQATEIATTTVQLNGSLSLGDETAVDVFFQHRAQGAGTWLETARVEKTAGGAFDAALAELTGDTTYEFRAAVEWGASQSDFGSTLTVTTGPTSPSGEEPAATYDGLTADSDYRLRPTSAGTVTGIAGEWQAVGSAPLRQTTGQSLIGASAALNVRDKAFVIQPADLALGPAFTIVLTVQRRALDPRKWMTVIARNDGNNQAGGIAMGLLPDGSIRGNVRTTAAGAITQLNMPAGTIDDGDALTVFFSVGAAGMRLRANSATAVVNEAVTSIATSITSRFVLGASELNGAAWDGAFQALDIWNRQLSVEEETAILATVGPRIRFAPPLTFVGQIGESVVFDPYPSALMKSAAPTITVTTQPTGASAVANGTIEVTGTAEATSTNGRYKLTDPGPADSPEAVLSATVTETAVPPAEPTRVGTGNSGPVVVGASELVAAWDDDFTPQAGDQIRIWAWDRGGVAGAPTSPGYTLAVREEQALTLSAWRLSGTLLFKTAGGSEPASITVTYPEGASAHVRIEAWRPPAGKVIGSEVIATGKGNTGTEYGKASFGMTLPAGAAVVAMGWCGRLDQGPEPLDMGFLETAGATPFSAQAADDSRKLRGAMAGRSSPGAVVIEDGAEWS